MGRRKQKQDKQEKVSMATLKQNNYIIDHPSLYMSVNGEIVQMKVGDEIALTKEQAARMKSNKMIKDVGKQIDVDKKTEDGK